MTKGLLAAVKSYAAAKSYAATKSYTAVKIDSLLRTSSTSTVQFFVTFAYVLFFCLLAACLFPTSPYSIKQYNIRD